MARGKEQQTQENSPQERKGISGKSKHMYFYMLHEDRSCVCVYDHWRQECKS